MDWRDIKTQTCLLGRGAADCALTGSHPSSLFGVVLPLPDTVSFLDSTDHSVRVGWLGIA
jgi:hypothetical protein